jgi:O-antigen ligase/polysaccharide polymerase Wzy-like membrane protein
MDRLGGPAGGAAAFALTAGLAADAGAYGALSYDRALLGLAAVALLAVLLAGGARPGLFAGTLVAALGLLTAWTAASWLWSESPPRALVEAPRSALYAVVAAAVVLAGRRVPPAFVAGGVAAGATLVAGWNLVVVLHHHDRAQDSGVLAHPVGYANSLGLLCALGIVLLLRLPRAAFAAAPILAADLAVQKSTGALVALAAGLLVYGLLTRPRLRPLLALLALACAVAAPFAFAGHTRGLYWRAALDEAAAHPVGGSGAGTFANWWLRERRVPLSTQEAHSLYLETLAELGPLGLALLLAALATPLAAAVRAREPALAASLAAYDIGAAVDFHWELAGVTVPMVLVAAAACVRASPPQPSAPRSILVPSLAVVTAAALLAYAGAARLGRAEDALRAGNDVRAASAARAALRVAPFSADAWGVIGAAESSAAAYRRAIDLDRNDWSLWLRLANVSKGEPRRLALREAARLNPLFSGR